MDLLGIRIGWVIHCVIVRDVGLFGRRWSWAVIRRINVGWMGAMELGLGEHEDDHEKAETKEPGVEPPEVSPTHVLNHGSVDDGTDH